VNYYNIGNNSAVDFGGGEKTLGAIGSLDKLQINAILNVVA
jgi:hypothetical protein